MRQAPDALDAEVFVGATGTLLVALAVFVRFEPFTTETSSETLEVADDMLAVEREGSLKKIRDINVLKSKR